MNLEYRHAVPEDAAQCIALRGKTRENAISEDRLRSMGITAVTWGEDIRSGAVPGQVCSANGRMIGYCFGSIDDGEIVVLALLPEYEGRGIGKELLGRMMDRLFERGKARLLLACSPDPGSRSHGFYRHLGWHSTGQFDSYGDEILEFHPSPGKDVRGGA